MRVYVANYDTMANIDAANDDRDMLQLEWEAGPKVVWTFFHNTEAQLTKMQTLVVEDVLDAYEEHDRPTKLFWTLMHEPAPEDSMPRYAYELWGTFHDTAGPEWETPIVLGALVIQGENTDDEP